jgi:hypothetical protein
VRAVDRYKQLSAWQRLMVWFACLSPLILMGASGCDGSEDDESRRADTAQREENFERAESVHPIPADLLSNFPMREALIKMTLRQDEINHPWYIYLYALDGTPMGYYVGETYPQNMCNFLSSSEKLIDIPDDGDSAPDFIVQAPSLDGVFYGGSGASGACNTLFFFDLQTDAMYTFNTPIWQASDKPIVGYSGDALGDTKIEDVENPEKITTPEVPEAPAPTATTEPE